MSLLPRCFPRALAPCCILILSAVRLAAVPAEEKPEARGPAQLKSLERLEAAVRSAANDEKRREAARRYREALREAGDLEKLLPLSEAESELCRVLAAEKSARAGEYERHTGHHTIVLAPRQWSAAAGPVAAEAWATLDAAFVLIEDLDGTSFERVRRRRLIVVFSPDHPAGGAQTLEGVVFAGLGLLGPPVNDQVLFHELGHEHFAAPNLRPRFENFNEVWPEVGRQYVLWSLGRTKELEANRERFLKAYRERYLAPGFRLESLEPYDTGAGMLQRLVDAGLRRGDGYAYEPLRAAFRRLLAVPAQTESFHQRQEILAWCFLRELGPAVRPVLDEARFDLPEERVKAVEEELRVAAPLFAELRARLAKDDLKGALALEDKLEKLPRPGAWASQGSCAVAAHLAARSELDAVRSHLARAGCILRWHVVGPFPNPRGAGMKQVHPPERGVDLAGEVPGPQGALRWRQAAGNATTGYVDLLAELSAGDEVLAYAYAEVEARRAGEADVFTGSDDALALFCNGELVASRSFPRGCFVDNDRTRVKLRAGKNQMLLKVGNFRQGFGFTCRVASPEGGLVAGR